MKEGLGEDRLTAHWAVLGKHPGRSMGYEVLRSSLPDDRASSYLWKAAATGAPDGGDPDGTLPWRVFLGSTDAHPGPVCACVETTWNRSTDGTGAPSYTWRLTLLAWAEASRATATWSGIDSALLSDPPALPGDGAPMTVAVPRTSAAELAGVIDQLGFEWAAGVAALLLADRQVAIIPKPGEGLPDVSRRVRVLDAVCALLPYQCRAWLSAATWTGRSQHDLRLFFASGPRTGQVTAVLGGGPPQEPGTATAQTYLHGLRRLRAKTDDTTVIVEHLLTSTEPVTGPRPEAALRALRDADLLDTVVEEIQSGGGKVADVRRVLERYPDASLSEHHLRELTLYLVDHAHDGDGAAGSLLGKYWTERNRDLLIRKALAAGTPATSFERAKRYLGVIHNAVEAHHPGGFDALFNALVEAPEPTPEWTGSLIYMAENEWGLGTDRADHRLVREPAVGRAWLACLLEHQDRSLAPLRRLVQRARDDLVTDTTPGWLRFAAVLLGDSQVLATAPDATDFAGAGEGGWLTTLEIARMERRPEVLGLMSPGLWSAVRTERGLRDAVQRLVPVDEPQLHGGVAADADLFCAAPRTGVMRGMPRLERLAEEESGNYADVLCRRIRRDGEPRRLAINALLSGKSSPRTWWVIEQLTHALPDDTFLDQLFEKLYGRLTERARPISDLDVPESLMRELAKRKDMEWLVPVHAFRKTVRDGAQRQDEALYRELARIVLEARANGGVPGQLLDEIATWTLKQGPFGLDRATLHMNGMVAGRPGLALYPALARGHRDGNGELVDLLLEYHEEQRDRHEQITKVLQHCRETSDPAPGTGPEDRWGFFKKKRRPPPEEPR
ncbi:hypothetical protein [Streptomyces sp. NPDC051738]|uniref:hypothetical protein n=1 Tax=Streptomyces sp. NPDC051738 TaxID=3365672 RepID=UPI0037D5CE6F